MTSRSSLVLALLATTTLVAGSGCEQNIPVDNPDENPSVPRPLGIVRGNVSYFGPPPCVRNGAIEGAVVLLLFDAANPPPPDGLASTALNFATVPGERLFYNYPRPATGPGSTQRPNESLCPAVDSTPIRASAEWTMQQIGAGRYQVRGFYSRQNRWNPLFNFANLPLAGDVFGGALVNPGAIPPRFATVEVGTPIQYIAGCAPGSPGSKVNTKECIDNQADVAAAKLRMPELGFIREGIVVDLLAPLRSNRPFFHLDYAKSLSFDVAPTVGTFKDYRGSDVPPDNNNDWTAQRKPLTSEESVALGMIMFPQDHISTSQQNSVEGATLCLNNKDPNCDLFKFAQASFPQIRFNYGFPGAPGKPGEGKPDYNLAKNAKPSNPFIADRVRPFYGIDPWEFEADPGLAPSGGFMMSRVFTPAGTPEILRDNETLESLAQIAELYPSVVLSKLQDDGEGNILQPPRSQVDPIVVIQTITVRDWPEGTPLAGTGSMKASSQSGIAGGALTDAAGNPDPTQPLFSRSGFEKQNGFTSLVRPSAVCIHAPSGDLRGTLVTPVRIDPNQKNSGGILVSREKTLELRANRVKAVQFGCLPPGYYSVNVVYPTGQAWSFPNLSGHCSYTAKLEPNEECAVPSWGDGLGKNTFPLRPLLQSQMLYQTDANGKFKLDANQKQIPQVVYIKPSPRCGSLKDESQTTCSNDDACGAAGAPVIWKATPASPQGICIADSKGVKRCDLNADGRINAAPVWVNNPTNEDTALDTQTSISTFTGNGELNMGEDTNGNGKLDMHVPNVCTLPLAKFGTIDPALFGK